MARHVDVSPNFAHRAIGVDKKGRALDAHIFPPVDGFLDPDAVGQADFAFWSEASVKVSPNFALNLSWLAALSRAIPITSAFTLEKSGFASGNPHASAVQPEVSSLG